MVEPEGEELDSLNTIREEKRDPHGASSIAKGGTGMVEPEGEELDSLNTIREEDRRPCEHPGNITNP